MQYRVGLSISRKVLQIMFWEVPTADWLICSYLLPRQALATHVEKHNKTLRLIGSPALYNIPPLDKSVLLTHDLQDPQGVLGQMHRITCLMRVIFTIAMTEDILK